MAKPLEDKYSPSEIKRAETRLKVKTLNKKIHSIISRTTDTPHDVVIYTIKCKVFGENFVNEFNERNNPEITDFNNHEKFPKKGIFNFLNTESLEYYADCAKEIIRVNKEFNYSIFQALDYLTKENIHFFTNPFNPENKPEIRLCSNDIKNLSDALSRRILKDYPSLEDYFKEMENKDIKLQEYAREFERLQYEEIYNNGDDVYSEEDKEYLKSLGYHFKSDDDQPGNI